MPWPPVLPEMRFDYRPGEWMMSDFSRRTMPVRTRDGEVMAETLVCLLSVFRADLRGRGP